MKETIVDVVIVTLALSALVALVTAFFFCSTPTQCVHWQQQLAPGLRYGA